MIPPDHRPPEAVADFTDVLPVFRSRRARKAEQAPIADAASRSKAFDWRLARLRWVLIGFAAGLALGSMTAGLARGETSRDWGGSSATLKHGEGDAIALVECVSRLTARGASVLTFDLSLNGLIVTVMVDQGNGDVPDTYHVTPPSGYVAVPPSVSVEENDSATILIFLADGGLS